MRIATALLLLPAACNPSTHAGGPDMAGAGGGDKEESRLLVRVQPVELRRVRAEVRDSTTLEAERRVTLQSKVAGRVREVLVDDGQQVRQGQVLARLDDREAQTTLVQVEVQVADARLRERMARLEVDAAIGRLEQARIERDRARAENERKRTAQTGLFSIKAVEEAQFAAETAEEALRVAQYARDKADLEAKAANSRIDELLSKRAEIELQLAEHEIKAPFDGVVVERSVVGGETVSSATPLFVVLDPLRLVARIRRPQRELAEVRHAREVLFTTDAFPGREFVGDVDLVSPVIDVATGSFEIRMRVRADDVDELVAGMFIRCRIRTEELREALMVPKTAILAEGDRSVVFAVRDGQAMRVLLEPGLEERDYLEARNRDDGGLRPDDKVVVSGQEKLRDRAKVDVSSE